MNEKTIWGERQNTPTLVVRDLAAFAPADVVYESLLRRGVFKWLTVRRNLIRLKDSWKDEIRSLNRKKSDWEKGYLAALERCRGEVRSLCHSERWAVPDNDRHAARWLAERGLPPTSDGSGRITKS